MYVSKDVLPLITEELKKIKSSFWGVLAILNSLDANLQTCVVYQIESLKIKRFLTSLFYFGEVPETFQSNDSHFVVFSRNWISELKIFFNSEKVNFYYVALWCFRFKQLPDKSNLKSIKRLFVEEFHINEQNAEDFFSIFDFTEPPDINLFDDEGFSQEFCLNFLKATTKDNTGNLTYSVDKFIVAAPWELTRASFVQPLYAGLTIQSCLIFSSIPLSKYYDFKEPEIISKDCLGIVVGMKSEYSKYGVCTVLDYDGYSYQVYCEAEFKSSKGIRTISKILLKEWIDKVKKFPEKDSGEIRNELKGKSDIDKFEYGNEAVLYKLAKMATGQIPYSIVDVSEYKKRRPFYSNIFNIYTSPDTENLNAQKLGLILKEMYDDPSTKKVPSIHAFGLKYGGVIIDNNYSYADIINASGIPTTYKAELDKAVGVYEIIRDNNFNMSLMPIENKPQNSLQNRLDVALKIFADNRKVQSDTGWFESGRKVNGKIREYFDTLTEDVLQGFDKEKIEEFFLGVKNSEGKVVFKPMWSGGLNTGWNHIKNYIETNAPDMAAYLVELKSSFDESLIFAPKCQQDRPRKQNEHPLGIGPSVISELLMKFHPERFFKYGRKVNEVMSWLGMIDFPHKESFAIDEYKQICGEAAKILEKMKAMKIPRQIHEDGSEDNSYPDYLTVNEFIWFVSENKDLIKEKIMAKKMKTEPAKKREKKGKLLSFAKDSKEDELLLRLLSALRAKPFVILAGHSGTGKSRYVKKLAYMTCNGEGLYKVGQLPGNYLLLQVKPNWHDSTELLGFRNAIDDNKYQKTQLIEFLFKAYYYKDTPFFLCLDEMNLAPVEQYFAEFLSAMESKEPVPLNDITADEENLYELGCEWTDAKELLKENGFSIPKNLFIVGTVNMDETTNQFSRKVLDRAFTIEMTDVDFTKFGDVKEPSDEDLVEDAMIEALLKGKEEVVTKLDEEDMSEGSSLIKVQSALKSTSFAIAYRFAKEYTLLKRAIKVFDKDNVVKLDALDQAVLMKILPRIAGEDVYINKVYGENDSEGLRKALEGKNASLTKIKEIMTRAKNMNAQYITFWP